MAPPPPAPFDSAPAGAVRVRSASFSRAISSIASEKSQPVTLPLTPTAWASSNARSPVPQQTSRALSPGSSSARSTARSRQRRSRPAVITWFMRSYTPAMRSNIVRTCVENSSESRLGCAAAPAPAAP